MLQRCWQTTSWSTLVAAEFFGRCFHGLRGQCRVNVILFNVLFLLALKVAPTFISTETYHYEHQRHKPNINVIE